MFFTHARFSSPAQSTHRFSLCIPALASVSAVEGCPIGCGLLAEECEVVGKEKVGSVAQCFSGDSHLVLGALRLYVRIDCSQGVFVSVRGVASGGRWTLWRGRVS